LIKISDVFALSFIRAALIYFVEVIHVKVNFVC